MATATAKAVGERKVPVSDELAEEARKWQQEQKPERSAPTIEGGRQPVQTPQAVRFDKD